MKWDNLTNSLLFFSIFLNLAAECRRRRTNPHWGWSVHLHPEDQSPQCRLSGEHRRAHVPYVMFLYKVSFSLPVRIRALYPDSTSATHWGIQGCTSGESCITADITEASLSTQTAFHCLLIYLFNLMTSLYDFCLTGGKNRLCKA